MTTEQTASEVAVQLTVRVPEDADAVFEVLLAAFPASSDGPPRGGAADEGGGVHPTVWSMTVDAATSGAPRRPSRLADAVTVDLQGGDPPVDEVKRALADAFTVEEQGTVPGDQEVDVRLRLTA